MAGDRPTNPHAWRTSTPGPAPGRGRRLGPGWRREAGPVASGRRSRRNWPIRFIAASLGLGILVGLLIWVGSWLRPPRTIDLLLVEAGYEENLAIPHNVYGVEAVRRATGLATPGGQYRLLAPPIVLKAGTAWDAPLAGYQGHTLAVILALHGGADGQGAYFLGHDADIDDTPDSRLRLARVIDRLAQLPRSTRKLLILDATQIASDWGLGMLHNDFARALEAMNDRIEAVPNLVVLSSSGIDQRSWGSDSTRSTTFTHFLNRGLRGAAASDNGRVDAETLFQFARDRVRRWADANFDVLQTPMRYPRGEVGAARGHAIELTAGGVPSAGEPATPLPSAVHPAWGQVHRLKANLPAPFVHAPHLWRRYLDTVIRRDQLARAGATDAAARMEANLGDLERTIAQARRIDLASAQATLTMDVVEGDAPIDPSAVQAPFDRLWDAPEAETAKAWDQIRADASGRTGAAGLDAIRRSFDVLLMGRAAGDPAAHWDRAARVARAIDDPARFRPAEIQTLLMLHRDLPADPATALLRIDRLGDALRLRLLAERAALIPAQGNYSHAGQVVPWVASVMAEADRDRRFGTDLLLADGAEALGKADGLFQQADRLYNRARDGAEVVRAALRARDEAFAALPYYSAWAGRQRHGVDSRKQAESDAMARDIEALWDRLHALLAALETPDPAAIRGTPPIAAAAAPPASPQKTGPGDPGNATPGLADRAREVSEGFARIEARFLAYAGQIDTIDLTSLWWETQQALAVPFDDLALRATLQANLARIEGRFAAEAPPGAATSAAISDAENEAVARDRARRQGLMAVALIGRRLFDAGAPAGTSRFDRARDRLAMLDVGPSWWGVTSELGAEVGATWRSVPGAINKAVEAAVSDQGDRELADLRDADRLARQAPGSMVLPTAVRPAESLRKRIIRDLLIWQSDRAWEDHWDAEDPAAGGGPYYRAAGQLFLEDAARLESDPNRPGPALVAAREKIARPAALAFSGDARRVVTDERRIDARYKLGPATGSTQVPQGYPVTWAEPGDVFRTLDPNAERRQVRSVDGSPETRLDYVLEGIGPLAPGAVRPAAPRSQRSGFGVRGLFRGQAIAFRTEVDLSLAPDSVVARPPSPTPGTVAIRAEAAAFDRYGTSNGSLAIVLDASGSMGPPAGQPWGPTTKYREALKALRDVLGKVSPGTVVSLWIFGESVGAEKTARDVERTAFRVRPPSPWDPSQLATLMAEIDYPRIEPWNESPIVRTMILARDDLWNAPGFRTMLVLTDGGDNRYEAHDPWNPGKKPIPEVLREAFEKSGIEINVVGYKLGSGEAEKAKAQFGGIEALPLPGKFYTVDQADELAGVLARALRRRLTVSIERDDNVPVPGLPAEGLAVGRDGQNTAWFPAGLEPSGYQVVAQVPGRPRRSLVIDRDDRLLVRITNTASGLGFARGIFSRDDHPYRPSREQNGWRLAVLQDQARDAGGLQMLVSLERLFDPRETALEMIKPRAAWFELTPFPDAKVPFTLHWGDQGGYPAPCWSLDVAAWPRSPGTTSPARPVLRAWWNPDQETPASAALDRGADFQVDAPRATIAPVPIDGDPVTVESATIEDHEVDLGDGTRGQRTCLVVRIAHAPGKPVWARPVGLAPAGQEHRFYADAARSTSLSWPITRDEADARLSGIELISVASFKANAARRGYTAEIQDLPTPSPDDARPRPVAIPGRGP